VLHVHAITGQIVGADLVEYNPSQDVSNLTAMACAKPLNEMLGKAISSR
jgi:arginase